MRIEIELQLSNAEAAEIAAILGCAEEDVPTQLASHVSASAQEYLAMYRGQKVFRRGTDILEHRLFLLIDTAFDGKIPDEHQVTSLFQTTPSESRALIRSVIAKYQYKIKNGIKRTIREILDSASQAGEGADHAVTINSVNIVEEMNRLLADHDGGLSQVKRKRGSVSTYEIRPSSFNALRQAVGEQVRAEE